jgi:hypothetical protein
MSRFWKDPQNIIAIGVTITSVCALVVSITQTRIMIRQSELMDTQARASVRPQLIFQTSRSFDPDSRLLIGYEMSVVNGGVGPASIDDVQVTYRGEPLAGWFDLIGRLDVPDTVPTYITNDQLNRGIVQAGQTLTFLDLSGNLPLARLITPHFQDLDIRVLYSSIYGDQFEAIRTEEGWKNIPLDRRIEAFAEGSFAN